MSKFICPYCGKEAIKILDMTECEIDYENNKGRYRVLLDCEECGNVFASDVRFKIEVTSNSPYRID